MVERLSNTGGAAAAAADAMTDRVATLIEAVGRWKADQGTLRGASRAAHFPTP